MARLTWLPDVLRAAGLDVYEMPDWATRGRSTITPQGVVCHHTATSTAWADGHVAFLLRDGRRDLAGPLAQLGLERDGTFVVVAAGRANHNGYGQWGNDSIGIEAYNDGLGEPWPAAQLDAYQRGAAALLAHLGYGPDRCKAHRETDPRRKPDPTGIDMGAFRARVAALLSAPVTAPNPVEEDHDMDLSRAEIIRPDNSGHWYVTDCITRQWIRGREHAALLVQRGAKIETGTGGLDPASLQAMAPYVWPAAAVASIRLVGDAPQ